MWILTNLFSYLVSNFNLKYNSCWIYLPSASVRTRQKSSSERFKADGGWRTRKADDVCVHIWTLLLKVMSTFVSISVRESCVRMADDVCAHMWTQPKIVNKWQYDNLQWKQLIIPLLKSLFENSFCKIPSIYTFESHRWKINLPSWFWPFFVIAHAMQISQQHETLCSFWSCDFHS